MRPPFIAVIALATASAGAAIAGWQARDTGAQSAKTLTGSAIITGVIVTDTARPQPVRRATVRLSAETASTSRLTGTDDDGRFVFDRLPAGRFTLSAAKAGFVQGFHGATRPGAGPGVPVAVADAGRVEVEIRLLPGAVITGIITDTRGVPVPGITVAAAEARSSGRPPVAMRAVTDDRGEYRIFSLPPGEYVVSAIPQLDPAPGGRAGRGGEVLAASTGVQAQPARPVAYAPIYFPGVTDAAAAATIRVASGEERGGADMRLLIVTLARVAGTLSDGNGQPITNASLSLVPKRGDVPSPGDALVSSGAIALPRAIASGSAFSFPGVAPGQYTLIARTGGGQRGVVAADAAAPTLWSVSDLIIDGADRTDLSLRLLPGLTVTGRIVFERKTAPAIDPSALNLSFVATNALPGVAPTYRGAVQSDGTFRVPSLAPGNYFVRVDPQTGVGVAHLKSAIVDGRDLADRHLVAIADGRELAGVTVTISDRAGEISGRVIDAGNRPITRYSIVVLTTDRSLWLPGARRIRAGQPATDGSYVIGGLPAGEYAIAAVDDLDPGDLSNDAVLSRLLQSAFKVVVAEGETKRQDLRVGG